MRTINIKFPDGGENRKASYAQKTRPYSSYRCRNVMIEGSLEQRVRGGSRPGIAKYLANDFGTTITGIQQVTYIDNNGDLQRDIIVIADGSMNVVQGASVTTTKAYLAYNGDRLTYNGDNLVFESTVANTNPLGNSDAFQMVQHEGKLFIADSTCRKYNPKTGAVESLTNAPASQPLVGTYQGRLVLFGEDHIIYMSKMGDFNNWNFGDDYRFVNRATALFAGKNVIGGTVNCGLNWNDKAFIVGTDDDLWGIYGNPRDESNGKVENISHHVGILSADSAVITPNGVMVFLAREGIYMWQIGSNKEPEPLSDMVVPEKLKNVDTATNDIMMEYDQKNKGIYLFITPNSGAGEHWWIDMRNKTLWPITLANNSHQPLAITSLPTGDYTDVIFGCKDGYLRTFDNTVNDDDSEDIESDVFFGPFHMGKEYGYTGILKELEANFASNSAGVTWKVYTGETPEEVCDNAEADLDAGATTNLYASGSWTANRNTITYPRARGAWMILWLSATSKWSYENIKTVTDKLGRIR